MQAVLDHISQHIEKQKFAPIRFGKVSSVVGLIIEVTGLEASMGEHYLIHASENEKVQAEVVGLRSDVTLLMPLDDTSGLKAGMLVEKMSRPLSIQVGPELLGRVVDANAHPIDNNRPISASEEYPLHKEAPGPMQRVNIDTPLRTGIRSIDSFITVGNGQRMGIFAGSGVGKSVLMGMIARHSAADVNVIALIGERGREVREFLDDALGEEGLKRSVVVAVTSDKAAMSRVKGAAAATAIAEYFRDQGNDVLLMMDSITRVAMAQREIGLASGEPPTTKGYPPSVFARMPRLLERAGKTEKGSITGLYTVLVENDDMNDPVADTVRSIIDGHIVLSRSLANRNHYPAVDVLESVSRVMPNVLSAQERQIAQKAREILATYRESEDLINIGAYAKGSNPKLDNAIDKIDALNDFLTQDMHQSDFDTDIWDKLQQIVGN